MRRASVWLASACATLSLAAATHAQSKLPAPVAAPAQETPAERDQRMGWWRGARFGLFIHWGLYSIPAGEWKGKKVDGLGEWIQNDAKVPPKEYEPLVHDFVPAKFDAKEWARIAEDAGVQYVVLTAKHHEGFALFDSKESDYDVMSAPLRRDFLGELAGALRERSIRFGAYYSILDWHHPDYLPRGPKSPRPWDVRPVEGASYDRYVDFMKAQLRELCTDYGELSILWFDGGWDHEAKEHRADEVIAMVRSLQPGIVINDRLRVPQDFDTPEQTIPATGIPGRDWETCMTLNDTWGFKEQDHHWKSTETLLRNLVDIASKGGNFLLNVGPTSKGEIPPESVQRLAEMGAWLRVNGESVYGTSASPFPRLPWGRCTAGKNRLYLHVFEWTAGALTLPDLASLPTQAWMLADHARVPLAVEALPDAMRVTLPPAKTDPIDSVVVLEFGAPPKVEVVPVRPDANDKLSFRAADAQILGKTARYQSDGGKDDIGFWTDKADRVSWAFELPAPGTWRVSLEYSCDPGAYGSDYSVSAAGASVRGKVRDTGSWSQFATDALGTLTIAQAGRHTLIVAASTMPRGAVMNLKSVTLEPSR